MAERKRRRLAGELPEQWQAPEPLQPQRKMVYKTHEPQPMQQQQSAVMDAATQARWDAWCDDRIEKMMRDVYQEVIGFALSEIRKQLRDEFNRELGQLRADLTVQSAGARGKIAEIKRNVA